MRRDRGRLRHRQGRGKVMPTSFRDGKLDYVTDTESASWQPEDWDDWPYERRRIWRLEQQCLRWEVLAFAARDVAHEEGVRSAKSLGNQPPSRAEITERVLALFEDRFAKSDVLDDGKESRFKKTAADVPGSDD